MWTSGPNKKKMHDNYNGLQTHFVIQVIIIFSPNSWLTSSGRNSPVSATVRAASGIPPLLGDTSSRVEKAPFTQGADRTG